MLEDYLALGCNFPLEGGRPCGQKVTAEAWATSCSHIFCSDHARAWFGKEDRCPVCLDREPKVLVAKATCSGLAHDKLKNILIGLNPTEIHLASTAALNFWIRQKFAVFLQEQEDEHDIADKQKRLVGTGRQRLTEADALQKSLYAGTEELRKQVVEAQRDLSARREEVAALRARLDRTRQAFRDEQSRVAGLTSRVVGDVGDPMTQGRERADSRGEFELRRVPLTPRREAAPSRRDALPGSLRMGAGTMRNTGCARSRSAPRSPAFVVM
mmetsp:Transcript_20561/g.57109  ORF Transcript_20561/g.57109 Transcript_20561/m.57109 type:complete len:270 (+) Transcript_20561:82-891(+)|eukprot:CAMPEP_0117582582 /NCGR_PEP_ID=MMETSP0784-20121206/66513_1 /TAXON_ID=39447 /ORGANISM="" /LENGTH=269 /DNA_ID=CAMNT_0005383121 /DNA_START=1 /DNA_END=810 /DNA_ORIENTATION=+